MLTTPTIPLVYTRVSSEDQKREGVSLDAQRKDCLVYIRQQGWVMGAHYEDVLSGTRDDRPAYQAMLAEARRLRQIGNTVAIVVAALDRLGRKMVERARCRDELQRLGVSVRFVRQGGELPSLTANVLSAVADEYVRDLGQKVINAKQHIISAG